MAPREILDSEDDGDDFDDQDYGDTLIPIAGAAPEAEDAPEPQAAAAPPPPDAINNVTNTSTLSTDPSFFERVYEAQYTACVEEAPPTVSDDITTQLALMPPSTRKSGRARAPTQKQSENNDVVDLTTPRKTAEDSVWDFPGSSLPPTADPGPAAASSSARSTRSARKRTQVSNTQDEDPYAFPASTPARSSKRTRRSLSATAESSPVALVPNATSQMYVAQSELTPSQKEQYATVSLPPSSTGEAGVPQPTLPLQLEGTEVHKSSGMTVTTIAYTTPSRIGSSSRGEVPSTGGENVTPAGYQSSPDVLNDMAPPSTSSNKRKARVKTDMDPPTSTASGRKTKKRRTIQDDDDNDGDFRAENDHSHVSEEISTELVPPPEPLPEPEQQAEPQPKKKRGRKKKEPVPQPEEPVPEVELREVYQPDVSVSPPEGQIAPVPDMFEPEPAPETVEPVPEPEPVPEEPPTKKRRGRPRKSDTVAQPQPAVIDVEEEPVEQVKEPLAELPTNSQPKGKKTPAAKGKGGKKKKEVVVDSDEDEENDDGKEWSEKQEQEDQEEEPVEAKKAAKEVIAEAKVEMKVEVKKVKDEKPTAGATPIKPAGYRVGLSKRSRIAPLLKSLKKP
ncbi:hypothetical protein B0T21DRAFT_345550 [Apiosordaria backusii]|uniref:AT hook domain-containing protein n=1 Tax=Apiosordaria backusii TaxID=314023 RepID=A0AA40ELS1_9PEZI|nr:hypothetical protein B0T21DRAFT_345550 [Apiosordaria backusii]